MPSLQLPASNSALCQIIAQRIAASPQQRITFAEFMELALYEPQHGYYATNRGRAGIQQDFFTSAHLSADFGELLAEQFAEMWLKLDCPRPFTLVEMGAGQGLLVQDIVRYLHRHHFNCFEALEYLIIEKSTALIEAQQQRLRSLLDSWGKLYWRSWAEIPAESIVGCCFSNELIDAFPVHLVEIETDLQEVWVELGEQGKFKEVIAPPSTPKLSEYFQRLEIDLQSERYVKPYRTEVNLAAIDWLATVAERLKQGYLLTIDYGYLAQRYYSPTRSQGTLQCYYQHAHHNDPYAAIGQQDITAHIDFTTLEQQGKQYGLQSVGLTQQGLFLMALGLGDRLNALSQPSPDLTVQDILQKRETLHALIDPAGLGNFSVLVQSKGLDAATPNLKGLTIPPLFS
jgi:SAM-dependent MidA family methyltransferase